MQIIQKSVNFGALFDQRNRKILLPRWLTTEEIWAKISNSVLYKNISFFRWKAKFFLIFCTQARFQTQRVWWIVCILSFNQHRKCVPWYRPFSLYAADICDPYATYKSLIPFFTESLLRKKSAEHILSFTRSEASKEGKERSDSQELCVWQLRSYLGLISLLKGAMFVCKCTSLPIPFQLSIFSGTQIPGHVYILE